MAETQQEQGRSFAYGWGVILPAATFLSFVTLTIYFISLGPSIIPVQTEFGWSRAFTAGAYSTAGIVNLSAPFLAVFIDRYGPRKMLFIGAFLLCSGPWIISFTDSSGILWYVGWIVTMGAAPVWNHFPANQKLVSNWFRRRRAFAMGIQSLCGAPSYIWAAVHSMLIAAYGWRNDFRIHGTVGFILYMVVLFFVRSYPEERGYRADGDPMTPEERTAWATRYQRQAGQPAARPAAATAEYSFTVWQALRTYAVWLICLAGFVAGTALQIQSTQQVPFLVNEMGIDPVAAGGVLGAMGLIGAPGRLAVGWLIGRFGKASSSYWYALAIGFEVVGMLILTQATSMTLVWVFVVVFGLGMGATVTAPIVMINVYFGPASFATVYSVRMAAALVATIVAPTFAAWVYDTLGSYVMAFWVVIVALAIVMVMILFATPPKIPIGSAPQPARS